MRTSSLVSSLAPKSLNATAPAGVAYEFVGRDETGLARLDRECERGRTRDQRAVEVEEGRAGPASGDGDVLTHRPQSARSVGRRCVGFRGGLEDQSGRRRVAVGPSPRRRVRRHPVSRLRRRSSARNATRTSASDAGVDVGRRAAEHDDVFAARFADARSIRACRARSLRAVSSARVRSTRADRGRTRRRDRRVCVRSGGAPRRARRSGSRPRSRRSARHVLDPCVGGTPPSTWRPLGSPLIVTAIVAAVGPGTALTV